MSHRDWLLSLAPLPASGVWVDLGCGKGEDVFAVARRHTAPALRFVGVDANAEAIAVARQHQGDDSRIEFSMQKLGDTLPFASTSVDVVYSHNLLECVADREEFVCEVGRVLRPGGWVVMAHWDWDSQLFDAQDKDLVRRLVAAFADWQQGWMDHADGWMGRRLWGLFNATGLFAGEVYARVLVNTLYAAPWYGHARAMDFGLLAERGLVSWDDYRRFRAEQDELSRRGRYFYSITGFAYVGQRKSS